MAGVPRSRVLRVLEAELQSELQLARVERAACLAELGIVQVGDVRPAQLEVGVVENVERFCAELQTEPVGKLEGLENGSIHRPISGPDKSVAPQIAHAAQTRRTEEAFWKMEAVSPLVVRRIHMVGDRIRTVIGYPIQVVVRARVDTSGRIEGSRLASSFVVFILFAKAGVGASSEGRPVGAALERPDPVPLPSAENHPRPSVTLPEKRQLPNVIESKPMSDVEGGVATVQSG